MLRPVTGWLCCCIYAWKRSVQPTLGPPWRAEEIVITRLRIGHTKATKSHILSRGPLVGIVARLTIEQILLEYMALQQSRDEYYIAHSLRTLFETIPEACIIEFLREDVFFNPIWIAISPVQLLVWISHQLMKLSTWINPHNLATPPNIVYRA